MDKVNKPNDSEHHQRLMIDLNHQTLIMGSEIVLETFK
jgi:hypothetical protein